MKNCEVELSRFIPNPVPENFVLACPAGSWMPNNDNGKWPIMPFAYQDWWVEGEDWYDGVTIHAGLNPFSRYDVKGENFIEFLETVTTNTYHNFPVGKARHALPVAPNGKIILDGIVIRRSEDEFHLTGWLDPQMYNQMIGGKFQFESEYTGNKRFLYQLCGDRSLEVIENACKQDMHDIKFMWVKDAKIAGHDVYIVRTGMSGTLAYEVHGLVEYAEEVYAELLAVGKNYGIKELGRFGYINQHTEGSIPQVAIHYAVGGIPQLAPVTTGSLPKDHELVYRSPYDLGWGNLVNFNHEFVGKEALLSEVNGPHRDCVHLIWNPASVAEVVKASLDNTRRVDPIDMYGDYDFVHNCNTQHIDAVYDGDRFVGASSGRFMSAKFREMISMASLDEDVCVDGKQLEVLWGNPGSDQVRVKVTVKRFPYFSEKRNNNFDLETIPHYQAKE